MEYDVITGNRHGKGEVDVDHDGIAWVSGRGGVRGLTDPLLGEDAFLLEVAGVTLWAGCRHTDPRRLVLGVNPWTL
jgi:hypothetical protein